MRSRSRAMSKSIVKSLEPDNAEMKGLNILTRAAANYVTFSIVFDGRIETFISTLDDLLRCVQAADATLGMIGKNKAS
ncbi:MAG TPA: KEOPS complex subunit Pcc1 [Candidatus Bathyarchaeia archaeon]